MSDTESPSSRRKMLVAVVAIGIGSAAVGAGAFAAFSDTEPSSDSLSTESLTLDKGTQTLSFTSNNIEPGDSGSSSVVLNSTGTMGGRLDVNLTDVINTDVESTTPEEDAEGGTNVPLADELEVKIFVEEADGGSGTEGQFDETYDYGLRANGTVAHGSGETLSYANVSQFTVGTVYQTMSFADSGSTNKELYIKWQLPSSASNAVQRDKTELNFDLTLTQN